MTSSAFSNVEIHELNRTVDQIVYGSSQRRRLSWRMIKRIMDCRLPSDRIHRKRTKLDLKRMWKLPYHEMGENIDNTDYEESADALINLMRAFVREMNECEGRTLHFTPDSPEDYAKSEHQTHRQSIQSAYSKLNIRTGNELDQRACTPMKIWKQVERCTFGDWPVNLYLNAGNNVLDISYIEEPKTLRDSNVDPLHFSRKRANATQRVDALIVFGYVRNVEDQVLRYRIAKVISYLILSYYGKPKQFVPWLRVTDAFVFGNMWIEFGIKQIVTWTIEVDKAVFALLLHDTKSGSMCAVSSDEVKGFMGKNGKDFVLTLNTITGVFQVKDCEHCDKLMHRVRLPADTENSFRYKLIICGQPDASCALKNFSRNYQRQ